MKLSLTALTLGSLLIAGPALSMDKQGYVTFDELKQSCERPEDFNNQNPPSNIRIQCDNVEHVWVEGPSRESALDTDREITTALRSNKFDVAQESDLVPIPESTFSCPVLEEVRREVSIERTVTCDELADVDNLLEFCEQELDSEIGSNPDIVTETETGRVADGCDFETGDNGQDNGQNGQNWAL